MDAHVLQLMCEHVHVELCRNHTGACLREWFLWAVKVASNHLQQPCVNLACMEH